MTHTMSAGRLGQITTCAILLALLVRGTFKMGWFRGFRAGRAAKAEDARDTVNALARVGTPQLVTDDEHADRWQERSG